MSEKSFGLAASEILSVAYHLIPLDSIRRLSRIFTEGIATYKDKAVNARNITPAVNNQSWQDERFSHAVDHLFKGFMGDTTEDHFAKVMWYCAIMMRVRELEGQAKINYEDLGRGGAGIGSEMPYARQAALDQAAQQAIRGRL